MIDLESALHDQLIALADDELILGHRDSEWCGHAPILEEDIAFANLALDEFGHARVWYGLAAGLCGADKDIYPDQMVFRRETPDFRCSQMVELPNGDWAFSMLRQYFFDAAEAVRLVGLRASQYAPLADAAAKIQKEELYHYRHTHDWVERLGLGTEESHRRMQSALEQLWPYTFQVWAPLPAESLLVAAGYYPPSQSLKQEWREKVLPVLKTAQLTVPESDSQAAPSRGEHTSYLEILVGDIQSQVRLEPEAEW
ncbi:MAG TPA: 1,2-phenylacetyl-CoA epoxidase subunit PaaC [Anaerolineales bacterium]